MSNKKQTVIVGLSGGVDSTVTAYLLKEAGYRVTGAFMLLWADKMNDEIDQVRIHQAQRAADFLGIEFKLLDFRQLFYEEIVLPFITSYRAGLTPNPCVLCNQKFKFHWLPQYAGGDYDFVATGHYVQLKMVDGEQQVFRGIDPQKDQSYVLYHLSQDQLRKCLFPLGSYYKSQVRAIAEKIGFATKSLSDSQDICFISPDRGYRQLLADHQALGQPGDFIDLSGKVVGRHQGIGNYTIGQRKHLGVALGKRVFVAKIDKASNQITLAGDQELFIEEYRVKECRFNSLKPFKFPLECQVAARYQAKAMPASLLTQEGKEDELIVKLQRAQRAVTPGQTAAFYQEDRLIGGGTIVG